MAGRGVLGWLLLLGLSFLIPACGGASKAAPARSEPAGDVESLSRDIETASQSIDRDLAGRLPAAGPGGTPATPGYGQQPGLGQAGTPAQPSPPTAQAPPAPTAEGGKKESSVPSACFEACRALGSMKRSADRICELVGATHERCTWARQRVADAEGRVSRAGCACSEP